MDPACWILLAGVGVLVGLADCVCGQAVIQVESMFSLLKQRVAQLQNSTAWQHA